MFFRLRQNKKAYFFVIDAFVALLILVLGVYMVLSSYLEDIETSQQSFTSKALMSFMNNVSVAKYNSDYKFTTLMSYTLYRNPVNFIRRYENSLLEQIGEFYYRENYLSSYPGNPDGLPRSISFSSGLAKDIVNSLVPQQFEVEMILHDANKEEPVLIYRRKEHPLNNIEETPLLIPSKAIVMGSFDDIETGASEVWGPYVIEVRIWR